MSNCTFILQARLGSTRLPNKMLLPFYKGKNIFEIMVEKLLENFPKIPLVLATSTNPENDSLEKISQAYGIQIFRGCEDDVLKRFIDTALTFNIKNIVRICSDNPFLDMNELRRLLTHVDTHDKTDYTSFHVNNKPSILSHFGFWAEYVTLEALQKVNSLTTDKIYHEHVTNYIYKHQNIFDIELLKPDPPLEGRTDIRMTLDTQEDFDLLAAIYSQMYDLYSKSFGVHQLIKYLDENIEYKHRMNALIQQNIK